MSAGDTTQGTRGPDGEWTSARQPGEYWRFGDGWCVVTPAGTYGDLRSWTVVEHEDKTITVSPSINANQGRPNAWHGYLERGIWREV